MSNEYQGNIYDNKKERIGPCGANVPFSCLSNIGACVTNISGCVSDYSACAVNVGGCSANTGSCGVNGSACGANTSHCVLNFGAFSSDFNNNCSGNFGFN